VQKIPKKNCRKHVQNCPVPYPKNVTTLVKLKNPTILNDKETYRLRGWAGVVRRRAAATCSRPACCGRRTSTLDAVAAAAAAWCWTEMATRWLVAVMRGRVR